MAEGSPAALKHSVGHDVIVAEVEGDGTRAVDALRSFEGLEPAWNADGTITVTTPDGAGGPRYGRRGSWPIRAAHQSLTMRTPTLDDVFMEMTGSRIEREEVHL